jgi:hypothetical protein
MGVRGVQDAYLGHVRSFFNAMSGGIRLLICLVRLRRDTCRRCERPRGSGCKPIHTWLCGCEVVYTVEKGLLSSRCRLLRLSARLFAGQTRCRKCNWSCHPIGGGREQGSGSDAPRQSLRDSVEAPPSRDVEQAVEELPPAEPEEQELPSHVVEQPASPHLQAAVSPVAVAPASPLPAVSEARAVVADEVADEVPYDPLGGSNYDPVAGSQANPVSATEIFVDASTRRVPDAPPRKNDGRRWFELWQCPSSSVSETTFFPVCSFFVSFFPYASSSNPVQVFCQNLSRATNVLQMSSFPSGGGRHGAC